MAGFESYFVGSMIGWFVLAIALMMYRTQIPVVKDLLKGFKNGSVFLVTLVIGLVVSGVGASWFSGASIAGTPSGGDASSGDLGTVSLLPVTGTGNLTYQDTLDKYKLQMRSNVEHIDVGGISSSEFNGTITIERTGGQEASCRVSLDNNPSYSNPNDNGDTKDYTLFDVDTYGDVEFYFDSNTFQGEKLISFSEGEASKSIVVYADITKADFSNITTSYGSRTVTVDLCGQEKLTIEVMKLS